MIVLNDAVDQTGAYMPNLVLLRVCCYSQISIAGQCMRVLLQSKSSAANKL